MTAMLQAIMADPTPGPSVRPQVIAFASSSNLPDRLRKIIRCNNDGYDEKRGSWGFIQKFLDWDSVEWNMKLADGGNVAASHPSKP